MRTWDEVLAHLKSSPRWEEIKGYLKPYFHRRPQLEEIWSIMNQIWDDMGLDNKNYNKRDLDKYYSHPVWFLNGLWIETDPISMQHREGMAKYVEGKNPRVLDYGGGFGTLAKLIASYNPSAIIDMYEPHALNFAYHSVSGYGNIKIIEELGNEDKYDYIFTTDVLEHVEDPISLIIRFNKYLKEYGILVAAWNFTPCIKCHLPKHFHYRYTMHRWIIPSLGFSYIEQARGGHGHVFKKVDNCSSNSIKKAYRLTFVSKLLYPIFRSFTLSKSMIRKLKGSFRQN